MNSRPVRPAGALSRFKAIAHILARQAYSLSLARKGMVTVFLEYCLFKRVINRTVLLFKWFER